MTKYIDADKLIAGIKCLQDKFTVITYEALFHLIDSLQQEQPNKYETALEKARGWMPNINQGGHAMLIDIFPELGEGLDPRYGGRKQKQPECGSSEKPNYPAEWSEEDKAMLNSILCEVVEEEMKPTKEQVDWLKSLRPQSKQRWSEEDKKMLCKCVDAVNGYLDWLDDSVDLGKWLKQLPERFSLSQNEDGKAMLHVANKSYKIGYRDGKNEATKWKPTEEQIDALCQAVIKSRGYNYSPTLCELYDNLKKLM